MQNKQNAYSNTCDNCNELFNTSDLIWITSEDFTPRRGEKLPKEAFKRYDALCNECYLNLLVKNQEDYTVSLCFKVIGCYDENEAKEQFLEAIKRKDYKETGWKIKKVGNKI